MNNWMKALVEWNKKQPGKAWSIPKKGTREYMEVKRMADKMK